MGARRDRFGDIAREAHAPIADERDVRLLERQSDVLYGGDLPDADAPHDARRADPSRPDADLHAVGPVIDERFGAAGGGDVGPTDSPRTGTSTHPAPPGPHAP